MRAMRRLIGDPLVHFLLIGAALFAVLSWFDDATDPLQIRISESQVRAVLQTRLPVGQSVPGQADLEALIEPLIRDELLYREALSLGLDVEDDQVRTRLIEKMRYVTEDLADPEPASEAQLRELFDADPARFAIEETVTFEHIFFSPSQRGAGVRQDAQDALAALQRNNEGSAYGDSTPLGDEFTMATRERLNVLFGDEMTSALFAMAPDAWNGPFESDFGLHLVHVSARSPARQPEYEEVRDQVREAFAADTRMLRNAAAVAAMRARYDIVIEWPEELEISD
jgi:hypothetical protein